MDVGRLDRRGLQNSRRKFIKTWTRKVVVDVKSRGQISRAEEVIDQKTDHRPSRLQNNML